jgi:hypothetical protein
MADTKVSALTALTGANSAAGDKLLIVDVSDTTMAASGTTKSITLDELQAFAGVPFILSRTAIPFIWLSSGSIGDNGALTGVTALPQTYSGGAYIWLPADSIDATTPAAAAWYWCVFSSTTAGTIYNSTYTSGTPTAGVTTAFATTGPGAFTGSVAEGMGPTITVPAGRMGPNGRFRSTMNFAHNNSAGIKTPRLRFSGAAGTVFYTEAPTTTTGMLAEVVISNRGSQAKQQQIWTSILSSGSWDSSHKVSDAGSGAINTAVATSIVISGERNTATDNLVLSSYEHEVVYAA